MGDTDWRQLEELRRKNLALLDKLRAGQAKYRARLSTSCNDLSLQSHRYDSKNVSFGFGELTSEKNGDQLPPSQRVVKSSSKSPVKVRSHAESPARARNALAKSLKTSATSKPSVNGSDKLLDEFQHLTLEANNPRPLSSSASYQDVNSSISTTSSGRLDKATSSANSSPLSKQGTPKSILKRRKIIDDNVQVSSKYSHTPNTTPTGKSQRRGLNFSYSDIDDIYPLELSPPRSNNMGTFHDHQDGRPSVKASTSLHDSSEAENGRNGAMQDTRAVKLKSDRGNERSAKSRKVTNFSQRPKTVVFDTEEKTHKGASESSSPVRSLPAAVDSRLQPPLLGYDWIAGVLENDNALDTLPEAFYNDIALFRKSNREECQSNPYKSNPLNLTRPISPEIRDPQHTCIHGYELNERLFTEPVNANEHGRSVCPICMKSREDPTPQSPGFIRVSIPKSAVGSPHEVKPHRRRSFEPNDSCALSEHCLAGWECIPPSTLPTASTVDMRKAIRSKQSMTMEETEKMGQAYSRSAKLTAPSHVLPTSTGRSHRSDVKGADDTLNRSEAMEWELRRAPLDPHYIKRK